MAMIPINDNWRIEGDPHCWIVQKYKGERRNRRSGESEPFWAHISFHGSLGSAAKSMALHRLRIADTETLAETIDAWESIAAEIDAAFERWREVA